MIYTFEEIETGETIELVLKLAEREPWLEDHPEFKQVHLKALNIVSGVGGIKTDDGFKDVLSTIADRVPDTPFGLRERTKTAKEVATQRAVDKWRKRRTDAGD